VITTSSILPAVLGSNIAGGAWMTVVLPVLCLILVLSTWILVLRHRRRGE